jgi:hypothetical protein
MFVIYVIIIGLVLWLLDYVAAMLPLPPPFHQVIRVVIAVVGVIVLIYLLLGLVGLAEVPRLR